MIEWTEDKLKMKQKNLSKVIEHMNGGKGPDILGLQEVENLTLLQELVDSISLERKYKIVHYESADTRGIDNALLYDAKVFKYIKSEPIIIILDENEVTRDILFCRLNFEDNNLDFYVNHWPSRREGLKKTEKKRIKAATSLVEHISSNSEVGQDNIIIMGDFNDLPSNISLEKIIKAVNFDCKKTNSDSIEFYNLSYDKFQQGEGTYWYRDNWNMLDQIIISNALSDNEGIDYLCESFEIIKPDFILQKEGKYKGTSMPTYGGRKYLGGYSDHFAIGSKFVIVR